MNDPAQLLVEHLDIWTGAFERKNGAGRGNGGKLSLYGIEKLRSLILDLAVRGKLVHQDPADEPASQLLKKLKAPKAKLVQDGKFKSLETDSKASVAGPFPLPDGWTWCLLDDIAGIARGGSPRPIKSFLTTDESGIPWIKIGDSKRGSVYIEGTEERITPEGLLNSRLVVPGDLILSNSMSFGFPYITKIEGAIHDGWLVIRTPEGFIDKLYLQKLFLSPFSRRLFEVAAAGAVVQNLNADKVRVLQVPLPPLAEQKRIAAKVNELMSLCDALEAGTREAMAAHEKLIRELLATLVNSADADDLAANWSRIETNFDTLFATEESVDALRQTMLELAVTGRLVEADQEDESVKVLVARVERQRAADIKSGRIRKQSELPPFDKGAFPGRVPEHWEIVQLDELVHVHSGVTKGRNLRGIQTVSVPYLRVANVQRWFLDLGEMKEIEIPADEREKYGLSYGDLLVTEGGDWDKVGRTCIWRGELEYCAHQNHVFKARKILSEQNEEWLELFLNSAIAREYFANASKQTTNLASINKTELRSCPIPFPPANEQSRILGRYRALSLDCDELIRRIRAQGEAQLRCAEVIPSMSA